MVYNAQVGTIISSPITQASEAPDGGRSMFPDTSHWTWRPFQNVAEVLAYFNTPQSRYGCFSIIINSGGTLSSGKIIGGVNEEWWFKDGVADDDLEKKASARGEVYTFYPVVTEGDTTVSIAEIAGLTADKILGVFRDGVKKKTITSGTPNDKQVKFISSVFHLPYPIAEDEDFNVDYKI